MSTKVLALCWEYPAETAAEKLILLKIGDQSNDHGQSIYFSMKTYARAGLLRSTRGARKILRRLEEKQILLDDPEFAADLRAKGRAVRARVYRLNLPKIREAIEEANRNPVPIDDYGESELSSASDEEANRNSVPIESELSSSNTYLESFTDNPHSPPELDFTEDFAKLVASWKPFDMLVGDLPQAQRKYTKIRSEGITADQVLVAARVYCQQCSVTRCKTKHIENWLGQCVWRTEDKVLGEGNNGKSRDKKPAEAAAEKPRALRHQQWHMTAKQQLGNTVYRAWIERLWLEGEIVYCPSRFTADYVQQRYGRAIVAAIGHEVRYSAELPPQHAFEDFVEHSAGEKHGQDQITA